MSIAMPKIGNLSVARMDQEHRPPKFQGDCLTWCNGLEQFLDHHLSNKSSTVFIILSKAGKLTDKFLKGE